MVTCSLMHRDRWLNLLDMAMHISQYMRAWTHTHTDTHTQWTATTELYTTDHCWYSSCKQTISRLFSITLSSFFHILLFFCHTTSQTHTNTHTHTHTYPFNNLHTRCTFCCINFFPTHVSRIFILLTCTNTHHTLFVVSHIHMQTWSLSYLHPEL